MFGAVVVVACAHADPLDATAVESPMNASLDVTPAATAAEVRFTVTLTNASSGPVALNELFFAMPSVSLQVRTRGGDSVPKGPPPVPPVDDGRAIRTYAPGESARLEYVGRSLFASELRPGDYEVRFHGWSPAYAGFAGYTGAIDSPWVPFHIGR